MQAASADIIDRLLDISPGSRLDGIRAQRPAARENAQKSYLALFEPVAFADVTAQERYAVAAFVAGLHREPSTAAFYASGLAQHDTGSGIATAVTAQIELGAATGPYGSYSAGPLSAENMPGLVFRIGGEHRPTLGGRLCSALEHAHLLVFHPRDAGPEALQALLEAGWSTTDIVTLSQLVSFLAFQIRIVAGLRAIMAEGS